jgi:uncharacterized membrane protein YgaE (UPF0421/DUF939 family)
VLADGGPARGLAAKTLNVVAILVGESYSPLFEDAAERLGVRIVGVFIGLAFALAVLALLAPTRRDAVEARS